MQKELLSQDIPFCNLASWATMFQFGNVECQCCELELVVVAFGFMNSSHASIFPLGMFNSKVLWNGT